MRADGRLVGPAEDPHETVGIDAGQVGGAQPAGLLAQLAGSFVTLVTPAAVGGATLNIRYLQRQKISAAAAAASVGVAQVVAFVLHIVLIVVFAAVAGSSAKEHIQPPRWAWFVLAGLVLIALTVLAIPAGRVVTAHEYAPPPPAVIST